MKQGRSSDAASAPPPEPAVAVPETAEEWNSGGCDVMAVALHRLYGLPLMAAFEVLNSGSLGCLAHAWVRLPDGRALDASGPQDMFTEGDCESRGDASVIGHRILDIRDDDPHLLDVREWGDYTAAMEELRAREWIEENLAPLLSELGIEPVEPLGAVPGALGS